MTTSGVSPHRLSVLYERGLLARFSDCSAFGARAAELSDASSTGLALRRADEVLVVLDAKAINLDIHVSNTHTVLLLEKAAQCGLEIAYLRLNGRR